MADQLQQALASLDAADKASAASAAAGDAAGAQAHHEAAVQIAGIIRQLTPTKEPTADTAATQQKTDTRTTGQKLNDAFVNYSGAVNEPVLAAASGAVMQPISGIAGLGAAGLKGILNLAGRSDLADKIQPGDVVNDVADFGTYKPQTAGGQNVMKAVNSVAGVIPKGANWAGEHVADATGSPLAGAAVNTAIQALPMALGAKLPTVANGVTRAIPKPIRNFVSDVTPGGSTRAANRITQESAGSPAQQASAAVALKAHNDAQAALTQAGQSGALADKYNIHPTTAQIADNTGLAQMDRTLRSQAPETGIPSAFGERDSLNNQSIKDILSGVSGTATQRLRATAARDFAADSAYDDALNNPEHFVPHPTPDMRIFANEEAAQTGLPGGSGTNQPGPIQGLSPVGARLQEVLKRPAMQQAMGDAETVAANFGKKIDNRNLIQQLHYAKMSLDDQISAAARSGNQNSYRALLDTKTNLLGVMDDLSPAYRQARESFQTASKPLNEMDIGAALSDKYTSALGNQRPSMFASALEGDEGDAIARSATGFGGAKFKNIVSPENQAALAAAKDQLVRENYARTAGRGVGSPTAQLTASQRAMAGTGDLRTALGGDLGAADLMLTYAHPGVVLPLKLAGAMSRRMAMPKLADIALNPESAHRALTAEPFSFGDNAPTLGGAAVGTNQTAKNAMWDEAQQPQQ